MCQKLIQKLSKSKVKRSLNIIQWKGHDIQQMTSKLVMVSVVSSTPLEATSFFDETFLIYLTLNLYRNVSNDRFVLYKYIFPIILQDV